MIAALERGRAGEAYNIAGSGSHRLDEVLELLERTAGRRAALRRTSSSPLEAVTTSACGAKAALELGYRPRVSLEDGIRRQLAAATAAPVELAA
jgi:nucleoside-diphosphate-sugar epimerase